ncbi:hypothetical protein [Nostoc sp. MG11]|uniref:hypothetical protein n=1 Tax=Nostoc sp. MG11 TaxID=2721166 RepID=UPI0018668D75|nr:hypothetical protein [Nostoc sp. MG11]
MAIAIPAYPPRPNQSLSRLQAIVTDSQAKVALTTTLLSAYLQGRFAENPLYPLLPFFVKRWTEKQLTITEIYQQSRRMQISCQETLAALANTDIVCPPVESNLLNTYLSYFKCSGFLTTP